jgi:hypothetical protein
LDDREGMRAIAKNPEILIRVLETVKSYLASSEESLSASMNPLDVIAVLDNNIASLGRDGS